MMRVIQTLPLGSIRRFAVAVLASLTYVVSAHAQAPLLPDAFPQYLSSTGAPLAGGTLTFDAAGTTTLQAVYSDSTLSTPLANPYTLDAAGRPPLGIYLSAVAYKIILKDASGVTIRTQDNVYGATYLASLAVAPSVQTTTSTGTVNDFATSSITANLVVLRCNNASDLTLTGFTAATTAGQQLLVVSIGAGNVFLAHQNTGSAAANRAINFATSATAPLAAGSGIAKYVYDVTTSRWRMLTHDQGAGILYTPTLGASAGTFSGTTTSTTYYLRGRKLSIEGSALNATVSATPANLTVSLPLTFLAARTEAVPNILNDNAAGYTTGVLDTNTAGASALRVFKSTYGSSNFAASAGTTQVFFTITFEVQD